MDRAMDRASPSRPHVAGLFRYPVKGLSAQALEAVDLVAGETMPLDRIYAIEPGPGRFDPAAPRYLPKVNFVMLMRHESLAALETRFEEDGHQLTILRDGKPVVRGSLRTAVGRAMIEQFLAAYLEGRVRGSPHIVHATGHSFSDVAMKCLHIINLESVRKLSRLAGREVAPERFRANVWIDGVAAMSELNWLDREIRLGDVRLRVVTRTDRCAATNVAPGTGVRDMAIPELLERSFGHRDFGVYARVVTGGPVHVGDPVETPEGKDAI